MERFGQRRSVVDLDTPALRVTAVVERQTPASLMFRGTNPRAQQIARRQRRRRIRETSARVEGLAA